jgi:hypothetical protein
MVYKSHRDSGHKPFVHIYHLVIFCRNIRLLLVQKELLWKGVLARMELKQGLQRLEGGRWVLLVFELQGLQRLEEGRWDLLRLEGRR